MFEACSESDSLFRTWSKHEAKMARSRTECKNDTVVDSMNFGHILSSSCHPWTLVAALKGLETLEDYGVILIPEGLIECSTWSCSMYETCNTMPVTMCQSLCNYIHHWFHVFFCCYAEICWGSSPNAMLWFQKSMTSFAARNPTNTGGTVNPCQGKNALHRCQEGARDERIPVIFESVFKHLAYSSNIACLYNQSCIEYQLARLQNDFYLPSLLNQLFCLAVA